MKTRLHNRRGQGMIEYAIILATVVVLAFALIKAFKGPTENKIAKIGADLASPD